MNYRKGISENNHMSPGSFWHTKHFCHIFTPVDQLFSVSCIKIDQLRTMSPLLRTTLWCLCVCWLFARGAGSTFYSFWSMDMTGVYACLCETVCDVTTLPSHLKEQVYPKMKLSPSTCLSPTVKFAKTRRRPSLPARRGSTRPHGRSSVAQWPVASWVPRTENASCGAVFRHRN